MTYLLGINIKYLTVSWIFDIEISSIKLFDNTVLY